MVRCPPTPDRKAPPARRLPLVALCVLVLTACAPRGALVQGPVAPGSDLRDILVATSRAPGGEAELLSGARSADLRFFELTVAVPPERDHGTVRFPRRGEPDPETDFVAVRAARFGGLGDFTRAVDAAAATRNPADREAVVFVHGFNTNFAEGLYRQAQIGHDFRSRSVSVQYSWPSAGSLGAYAYDRESALFARDGLETTLDALARSDVPRIVVMAHSMGAHLAMESLRQMQIRGAPAFFDKLAAVVLMAPDMDIDLFRQQALDLAPMDVPIYVFVSSRDRALQFSSLLRGRRERLGSLTDGARLSDLNVAVIDLSHVDSRGDPLQHFKVASSPTMFNLFADLGTGALDSLVARDTQTGILGGGVVILDRVAGAITGTGPPR